MPTHQVFGWFEYNLQNLKYASRRGIAAAVETYRESAGAAGGVVGKAGLHDRFGKAALGSAVPKRVLDIGCGFGRSTLAFANLGSEVEAVGIDLSASCVRLSKPTIKQPGSARWRSATSPKTTPRAATIGACPER